MKNTMILLVVMTVISITVHSQDVPAFETKPYFSAVIVKEIDLSVAWYQSILGLKIKNRIEDPERSFRVAILESPELLIELIENKTWPDQKKLLENKPEGTHIQGFFKIGFKVSDMDACIKHLGDLKISTGRVYTDSSSGKRNFLINDPDGNLVQFFE